MKPKNVKQAMFKFQFLLVRLKVHYPNIRPVALDLISIPSGTIKRFKPTIYNIFAFLFQFLLVRLKVCHMCHIQQAYFLFQFLLVRLKESKAKVLAIENIEFQFLLVRLKARNWLKTLSG